METVAIIGGPKTGKTTLANKMAARLGITPVHTDDFIPMGWSESSAHVATMFGSRCPVIIEGVTIPRALRKFLAASEEKPCDRVIFLTVPMVDRNMGQSSMSKGIDAVWSEIEDELSRRGVLVQRGEPGLFDQS